MALFKINRGGKENLSNAKKNDGWAYFTPDTKGFYIDVVGDVNGEEYDDRIQINERVITMSHILPSDTSAWNNLQHTISLPNNVTKNFYRVEVQVQHQENIEDNYNINMAMIQSNISYEINKLNKLLVFTSQKLPTRDIPIIINYIPIEKITYYSITTEDGLTIFPYKEEIEGGMPYNFTIQSNSGLAGTKYEVKMGGEIIANGDVNSQAYITIPEVLGDIVISGKNSEPT